MAVASPHLRGCWVKFAIDLHPSRSEDVIGGVKEQLNGLLLRYSEDLEAVVVSYEKERIVGTQAKIHPYFPYFHVDVAALVFMFKPVVGAAITGVVNAIGHDYIGVLVLGIFNAVIGRAQIPAHMQCRPMENCWSSSRDRHSRIETGSKLSFAVHAVDHASDFFTLSGSLLEPDLQKAAPAPAAAQPRHQSLGTARPQPGSGQPQQRADMRQLPAADGRAADAGETGRSAVAAGSAADKLLHQAVATDAAAPSSAAAAATANAAKQPEHRKKNKRRDRVSEAAGLPNSLDSAVKPPKKKKRKVAAA